jgi:esterase/lipase superfamily enzyme
MPTYLVTNRTARDATTVRPVDAPISVLKSPNDYDADYGNYQALTATQIKKLAVEMPNEARALANDQHYPLIVVFIHGYNNNTDSALEAMSTIGQKLQCVVNTEDGKADELSVNPLMICFDWPSNHKVWGYLGDEGDAMQSVPAVMKLLEFLDNWRDPINCKVQVSVIAHSMGNYVLMQGAQAFWQKLGRPVHVPYLSEVLMVAADITSDALVTNGAGCGITSLSRRVTAYFSRNDNTLGMSHLVKHPGAARLGRVGPNDFANLPPNVVAVDCTNLVKPIASSTELLQANFDRLFGVHSAYWNSEDWELDAGDTLLNVDRNLLVTREDVPGLENIKFLLVPNKATTTL